MRKNTRKVQFPCGSCKVGCQITSKSLLCEVCDTWFHCDCEGISKTDYKTWGAIDEGYICRKCRSSDGDGELDYLRGLARLEKAAKSGVDSLKKAAVRESLFLGENISVAATSDQCPDFSTISVDENAKTLLSEYFKDSVVGDPLTTTGDGDCLFNAVSILLVGNESLCVELRYKTVLMMIKEETSILEHEKKADFWCLSPSYKDAILECARIGAYSSVWAMMALSLVVKRPIRSVWPPVFGEKHLTFRTLNTVFNDVSGCDPFTILWSTMSKVPNKKSKKEIKLNHFVAMSSYSRVLVLPEENVHSSVKQEETPSVFPTATPEPSKPCATPDRLSPIKEESLPDVSHMNSSVKRKLEMSTIVDEGPSTSTPTTQKDEEWQTPKRRRHSSQPLPNSSLELSNRYDSLSVVEPEDEEDFVSDPDAFIETLQSRNKNQKRKRPMTTSKEDSDAVEVNTTPTKKKAKGKHAKKSKDRRSSSSESDDEDNDSFKIAMSKKQAAKRTIKSQFQEVLSDEEDDCYWKEPMDRTEALDTSSDTDSQPETADKVPVDGPHRGKLSRPKFMSSPEILDIFREDNGSLEAVPSGIKENMYFIIDHTENGKRKRAGERREFWDDCGAWTKSSSPSTYILASRGRFVHLTKYKEKYGIEKKGKVEFLDPQPDESEMIIIGRAYSKLSEDKRYSRRISWIANKPEDFEFLNMNISVVEYTGDYPGRRVHGNVKNPDKGQPYIKAKPSMKKKAANMIRHESAKNVYDELNQGDDLHDVPKNLKMLQNMKYNMNRKTKNKTEGTYMKNTADHLIYIENKVYGGDPFIRTVTHLNSGPSVLLYTDEQIQDVKRFCAREDDGAILGVDKTYNLGQLHLTTTVFKNLSVNRTDTGEPPIFLGPSFLHRKSDFETFNVFFSGIASHFTDEEIEKMVIGSDDETALRKSIRRCFPGATQIVCTRHLKNNVKDYLSNKIGVNQKDKKVIVNAIFGDEGLTDANSTILFDHRVHEIDGLLTDKASDFKKYMESRLIPLIRNHVNLPTRLQKMDKDWSNNNAESMNNILKIGTNHKVEDMADLIDIIHRMVKSMYKDVEKSFVGMGNYSLRPPYSHYRISVDAWCNKGDDERKKILQRFHRDKGRTSKFVTSTNGRLTVPQTPGGGKKPHQRKRMVAERATPRK